MSFLNTFFENPNRARLEALEKKKEKIYSLYTTLQGKNKKLLEDLGPLEALKSKMEKENNPGYESSQEYLDVKNQMNKLYSDAGYMSHKEWLEEQSKKPQKYSLVNNRLVVNF